MKQVYEKLYDKMPDIMARPVHVANSDPLYNKITITDNGDYDVSSYAEAKINVENGDSSSSSGSFDYPVFTFNESANECTCSWTYEQIYEVLASDPETSRLGCIIIYPDLYSSGSQLNIAFDYDNEENIVIGDYIICNCIGLSIIYNSDNTIIFEQDHGNS